MLIAEPVHYVRAAADDVAYHSTPGGARKFVEHIRREAVWKSREGFLEMKPGDLPVPGGAVFARGCRFHGSPCAESVAAPLHSLERTNVAEAEPLQSRQFQSIERARHVPQRVAAGIAVFGGVRRFADANSIEDDDRGALQLRSPV